MSKFETKFLTIAFLNYNSVRVCATVHARILLSQAQDVLQSGQGHLNDPAVHYRQQVAQRRNTALVYQKPESQSRKYAHYITAYRSNIHLNADLSVDLWHEETRT